jgi:hypothetical protein
MGILVMAVVGTFIGAYSAFLLERRERAQRRRAHEVQQGRRAQLALATQLMLLLNLKANMIDGYEDNPRAWVEMVPVPVFIEPMLIDFASLDCLLRPEAGRLIHDLVLAEQSSTHIWGMASERNRVHLDMQRRAALVGDEKALDTNTVAILKSATNSILGGVPKEIKRHFRLVESLGATLRRMYPGESFITIEDHRLRSDKEMQEYEQSRGRAT